MTDTDLIPYGWSGRWQALFAEHGETGRRAARVVRHDGSALAVATGAGPVIQVPWRNSVPPTTVGDWVVLDPVQDVAVDLLARSSLLVRRDPTGGEQLLAANVDVVGVVTGLDRPVRGGRIQRTVALAWDAGAVPLLVVTKLDTVTDPEGVLASLGDLAPGLDVVGTSSADGRGLDALQAHLAGRTSVLIGESGAGKSTLVNALLGTEAAATGAVRSGDAKGRHTTSARQLHLLPAGPPGTPGPAGVLIDTPGLRSVGLLGDVDAVDETFPEIDELADGCRFTNCGHHSEPGCAVVAALARGEVTAARLEGWERMRREAESEARRADEHARRQHERKFGRIVKDAVARKGRDD